MKVALLTNFVAPHRLRFYQALSDQFDDLTIFVSTRMEANRQWRKNWEDLRVVQQKTITLKQQWNHPSGFRDVIFIHIPVDTGRQLRRFRPNWIIAGELGMRTLQAALYCRLHPSTKLAIWATVSESTEQGRGILRQWLRKWLIPHADLIFVNGTSGERYIKPFTRSNQRFSYAPYSIDTSVFHEFYRPPESKTVRRFLTIGQLISRKGVIEFQTVFLHWAKNHPEQQYELIYVGDGNLRPQLEQQPLPENVHIRFLGHVEYEQLPVMYQLGDVLVFPTLADEWGVVVNEAMASGLPVLGSLYSQAVEELIEEGVTGWLFYPDRPDEIYAALERVHAVDDETLWSMGVRAHEVIQKLNPAAVAEKMANAMKELG